MCCRQGTSTVVIFATLLIDYDACSTLDLGDCGSEDLFVCGLTYLISRPRVYNNNYFTESTKTSLYRPQARLRRTHTAHSSHLERIAITSFLTYFFLCFPAPRSCCHCISDTPLTELKMEKTIITPQH